MKRFLTYSALFLAIMLSIIAVAEMVARAYPNSYAYKKAWMDANAERVRTLILGGSHTYYAVKPDLLGANAFSLANVPDIFFFTALRKVSIVYPIPSCDHKCSGSPWLDAMPLL